MNKERKQRFNEVTASLEEAKDILNDIQNDEQDAYDSLPVGLQMSSRGDQMQEYIDLIDECIDKIDTAIDFIETQIMNV